LGYYSTEPDDSVLRALLTGKSMSDGGLACRLPRGPSEPSRLSPQQQREAIMRLKTGERASSIAAAYDVGVAEVARLTR
jgi:hypothetical protein